MFCQKCGNKIPDNAKFCNKCGKPVKSSSANSRQENVDRIFKDFFRRLAENRQIVTIILIVTGCITLGILCAFVVIKNDFFEKQIEDTGSTKISNTMEIDNEKSAWDEERFYQQKPESDKNETIIKIEEPTNNSLEKYDYENNEIKLQEENNSAEENLHIEDIDNYETEYIFYDSNTRYLTKNDLNGLNAWECRIARNELYARHGRLFDDEALQTYFNSKNWYDGRIKPADFQESMLNDCEIYNRDLIVSYEQENGYR